MFRRKNRKKQGWGEWFRSIGSRIGEATARVGPYLILVAVAVGIPYLVWTGYQRVMTSSYFELSSVKMHGVKWADESALRHRAGLLRGVNVFDLDTDGARRALEANPWVVDASVERNLPDGVVVDIRERRPAALLVDDGYTILDEKGAPIITLESVERADRVFDLLPVTGLSSDELDGERSRQLVGRGLEAARYYREQGLGDGHQRISELHLDPVLGLTIVTAAGTEIRLGTSDWTRRLERLPELRATLEQRGIEPAYILLDHRADGQGGLKRVTVGPR